MRASIEFVVQSIIATVGAIVLGEICGLLLSTGVVLLVKNSGPGNFVDHLVNLRVFRLVADNPYFLGPIVVAFVLGLFASRAWKTNSGFWVWLLPTVILVWNVLAWKSYSSRTNFADAWANYFGSDCGDSECLYEVFVTAPFYTSVAYSLGWITMRVLGPSRTVYTAKT